MIEISITEAFIFYSFIIAISGIILWSLSEFNIRKIYTVFKNQNVWKCNYCAFVYLDTEAEEISQCPRCYSYNVMPVENKAVQQSEGEIGLETEPRRNPSHKKTSTCTPSRTRRRR
jgi:hypothetical protein